MLDTQSKAVYEALKKLTGEDDVFKVIEAEEIIEMLTFDMTKVQLSAIIRDLRDREYIKVKYFTPDEYCLLTLKKLDELASIAEEIVSTTVEKQPVNKTVAGKNATVVVKTARVFWAAFLGALLGGGIVAAIAVILQIFVVK